MLSVSAIEDRLAAFDLLVKKVCESAKVCNGNSLLDFFGVSSHKRIEVFQKKQALKKKQVEKEKQEKIVDEVLDESDEELFGVKDVKKIESDEEGTEGDDQGVDADEHIEVETSHPLAAGSTMQADKIANDADDETSDLKPTVDRVTKADTSRETRVNIEVKTEEMAREDAEMEGFGQDDGHIDAIGDEDDELFKGLSKPKAGYSGRK